MFFAVGVENSNYEEDLAPYARIVAYRIYQTKLAGNTKNQEVLWQRLYSPDDAGFADKKYKYKIGDRVRISKYSSTFEKGYLPLWSEEVFTISQRHSSDPHVYSLQDDSGVTLDRTWYTEELQKVDISKQTYTVEKILGQRKLNGKIQYLVRWVGYPSSFDSYVDKKDLIFDYKN